MKSEDAAALAGEVTERELSDFRIQRKAAEGFFREVLFANADFEDGIASHVRSSPGTVLLRMNARSKTGHVEQFIWICETNLPTRSAGNSPKDQLLSSLIHFSSQVMYRDRYMGGEFVSRIGAYRDFLKFNSSDLRRVGITQVWDGESSTVSLEAALANSEREYAQELKLLESERTP